MKILFVGHTSVDHIRNIRGEKVQPGGAALYAAMGAKTVCSEVGILTAIGNDYPFPGIFKDFDFTLVKRAKKGSTEFFITYDKNWNATYRKVSIGPGSLITTRDVLSCVESGAEMIHLAPMNPPKVKNMVSAIKASNKDVIVSINSCINYMGDRANCLAVLEAAALADIFILNERELHALTGMEVVSKAVKGIKSKTMVLTLGEIGTIISSQGSTEFIPAMSAITKSATDVTGAGDTWSGSFVASYLSSKEWIKAVSFASVVSAIKCTGWNFEKIRSLRFKKVEDINELAITLKEKGRQLTLSDALGLAEKSG